MDREWGNDCVYYHCLSSVLFSNSFWETNGEKKFELLHVLDTVRGMCSPVMVYGQREVRALHLDLSI